MLPGYKESQTWFFFYITTQKDKVFINMKHEGWGRRGLYIVYSNGTFLVYKERGMATKFQKVSLSLKDPYSSTFCIGCNLAPWKLILQFACY